VLLACTVYSVLHSEITHVHVHFFFLLRMTDARTSQNIDLSSWDTLYKRK
jgi:hypothetical protein